MAIESISIDGFRNLDFVDLSPSPQLNLFTGANAAGKTSLLEALYVLGRGRSFRSSSLDRAIRKGADRFEIVARVTMDSNRSIPVGMRRSSGTLEARLQGRPIERLSDLAALFPLQWVGGNLHALLEEGPARRRQFLDWGLFHVKHGYLETWKRFQKLLKQRNAALRAAATDREIRAWDPELADVSAMLDRYRSDYVELLNQRLDHPVSELLFSGSSIEIHYRRGWGTDSSYIEYLNTHLAGDRDRGFTRSGPQRAELQFRCNDQSVNEQLSRGQQKLFVIALQAVQAQVLKSVSGKSSLFLIDDIGSELDEPNQCKVVNLLLALDAQIFVTSINDVGTDDWAANSIKRFHVKHGKVTEVI
jgi:DNA replication and repair protein RecF